MSTSDDSEVPQVRGRGVLERIDELTRLALGTYCIDPDRVEEDANGERRIHQGGYGDRQLFELVQNAADELREPQHRGGRIQVILTEEHLYCGNEGAPITPEGADTILRMGVSRKRGGQIGRFGVGVKSVLSVTRAPQFFSETGSFGFDADWSTSEIRTAVNEGRGLRRLPPLESIGDAPVLRLARRLDVERERALDPILDDLLAWATTVVRLPLVHGAAARLGNDIHQSPRLGQHVPGDEFPHLFQLFSGHVGTVTLEDRRRMPVVRREITADQQGTLHTIRESRSGAKARSELYRVFTCAHEVSEETRGSAGELHDRVAIDVSWAVPKYVCVTTDRGDTVCQVPNERGLFWSFFPTKYAMTLSGVLNAAWKTNEDRQNLLDSSDLNWELLDAAARLVVDSLPQLVAADDPCAYLPLLPGRTKESPNWACEYLTDQVWRLAAVSPSLPDQNGDLRKPAELRIHPERLSSEALAQWRGYPGRPDNWVHHSVDASTVRRGKMKHIVDREPESIRDWLEALVQDGTAEASAAAIRVLAHLLGHELASADPVAVSDVRQAKIVLTEAHGFVAPTAGRVFRRSGEDGLQDDMIYVDGTISDDPAMGTSLDMVGIREADVQGRFRSVVDQGFRSYDDDLWVRFWELQRSAGGLAEVQTIRDKVVGIPATLRVRTMAGEFRPLRDCLLPGPVVPGDGSRDGALTVDMSFHTDDELVLREFGMSDRPSGGHQPVRDAWFAQYHDDIHDEYCRNLDAKARRPLRQTVTLSGAPTADRLHLFPRLSDEGKAAFLAVMPDDGVVESWTRQIGSTVSSRTPVRSPVRWLLLKYGMVQTSLGLVPVRDATGPQLGAYANVLPVAKISEVKARRLGMPTSVEDVEPQRWSELLDTAKRSTDASFVGSTYALLIRVAPGLVAAEETMRCRVGDAWQLRPFSDVAVAVTEDEYSELVRENHPALLVASESDLEQVDFMIRDWGMRPVEEVIEKRVSPVFSGDPVSLSDVCPPLRQRLGRLADGFFLQRCSELEEVVRTPQGTRTNPLAGARQDRTLLVPDSASFDDVLILADREFGWGLGAAGCRMLIEAHHRQQEDEVFKARLGAIRRSDSTIEKIAALISEDDLRKGLPTGLLASELAETGNEPDRLRLAAMAYNAHGDGVLRMYAKDIAAQFPNAPTRFDGGQTALRFVTDLGFPDSFAGANFPAPPTREEAEGPKEFPALHEYQERIASRLAGFLCQAVPQRAMLCLPTAAGKTRVAVEGVIRSIRELGTPTGPIVWIAQTTELCEQAVQSWKFVWEKVGAEQSLVIDRLWHTNSATPVTGRPHLVVTTDAKLRMCLRSDEYGWLKKSFLVIVDEAHVAIAPQYTEILEQMGLTHRETSRHLVGLTATPFRSDAELTRRLVQRFGNRRLDEGVFPGEPIHSLQETGVLARVEHRELIGADMKLNVDELAKIKEFNGFLPKGAEQRLAEDQARNKVLVEEICALPDDWPVLVFATSVQHAKFLAAKLGDRGIRSAAIDSATPLSERRQRIDAFRRGDIRVLTNYGVLSQGFDAPATRAVVIARPVYSANSYQQMIGRGLRGVRNGGKESCLILDVRDNITNYQKHLVFTDFEYLWQKGQR